MQSIEAKPVTEASIGIVVSRFNEVITQGLLEGCLQRLQELQIDESAITVVKVPGAVEIPLLVQCLARQGQQDAIIALGAVIRGETSHYDYVCDQVSQGCQQISLAEDIPVIFGVLTTENQEQALDRSGGKKGNKGRDAAEAALDMLSVLGQLKA